MTAIIIFNDSNYHVQFFKRIVCHPAIIITKADNNQYNNFVSTIVLVGQKDVLKC
jgi:hypothetical protein